MAAPVTWELKAKRCWIAAEPPADCPLTVIDRRGKPALPFVASDRSIGHGARGD